MDCNRSFKLFSGVLPENSVGDVIASYVGTANSVSPGHPERTMVTRVNYPEEVADAWAETGVEYYEVQHRFQTPTKVGGWFHDRWVEEVITEKNFPLFYFRESELALFNVQKDIARNAVLKLESSLTNPAPLRMSGIALNIDTIRHHMQNVRGAYVRMRLATRIKTQAQFGDMITEDPEFTRLAQLGDITSISIERVQETGKIAALIGADGSILFYTHRPFLSYLDFTDYLLQLSEVSGPEVAESTV